MLVMEAISVYVRTRRSEGYSPATPRQFSYQLNRFGLWFGPRPVDEVSLQVLRDFVAGFDNLKAQSLGHVVRILRGFFRWLFEEELIPRNPALKLKEPKAPKAIPKALNFEELELLRDASRIALEHALLEFLFVALAKHRGWTGTRLSGTASASWCVVKARRSGRYTLVPGAPCGCDDTWPPGAMMSRPFLPPHRLLAECRPGICAVSSRLWPADVG